MNFLSKLQRKYGRYGIPNLMKYIIIIRIVGAVLGIISPYFYPLYLALDIRQILHGQVWRLVTFLLAPYDFSNIVNILFFFVEISLYYSIGNALENAWGTFIFNLYIFSGMLFNILAAVVLYLSLGLGYYPVGLEYIYQSMFLAFAVLYPDLQFMLCFAIPIKAKWLAWFYAVILGWDVFSYIKNGILTGNYIYIAYAVAIVISMGNFLIYFFGMRNAAKFSPKQRKRRNTFKNQVRQSNGIVKHKCAICGRTDEDGENLEFRFCSKCQGNYEYCNEHLFTHEHVKK